MHSHSHVPHDHAHGHDDPHDRHAIAHAGATRRYYIGVGLNILLVIVQAVVGFWIGSMALLGDAGHNAGDVLGLILALWAMRLAKRKPDARHTYGYARSTIFAANINAALLLIASGALAVESIRRFGQPVAVPGFWVMIAAAVGLVVNAGSAAAFWGGSQHDSNLRAAFLHLVADAAVSLGVLVVGLILMFKPWYWLDPLAGLLVSVAIAFGAIGLLRDSIALAMDAVPKGLDVATIEAALGGIAGVRHVHDLHVWPLSTTVNALTAHVEHDGTRDGDALLRDAEAAIQQRFGISHTTIQLENVGCERHCETTHEH
ncbi:MAG: cation transporter [Rhodanobacteraceae bacterium]|nr:cation transporter [Rhodanobacteraceae bacterium]